jgi:hypothetical protein
LKKTREASFYINSNRPKRKRKYCYKPGDFEMSASFRRPVPESTVRLVEALVPHFTQARIASIMGYSTATIGKIVRIINFRSARQ